MSFDPLIGRRTMLRLTGMTAGLIAVSRLQATALADAGVIVADAELRVLSAGDARVLAAIAERMVATGDASMPRFSDTPGLKTIDTALLHVPEDTHQQLHWALLLFQYGPPVFGAGWTPFTELSESAQDAYLTSWADSRFQTPRLAFRAFKNLAMLGYYAQDATWKNIHYDGPWVPRPRRPQP